MLFLYCLLIFLVGCKLRGDVNNNLLRLRFNQDGDFICMKRLLQKGADVNTKDSYDYSPIMYAAKGTSSKAFDAVKYLVNKGAHLNAKNYYNNNALQLAGKTFLGAPASFAGAPLIL